MSCVICSSSNKKIIFNCTTIPLPSHIGLATGEKFSTPLDEIFCSLFIVVFVLFHQSRCHDYFHLAIV